MINTLLINGELKCLTSLKQTILQNNSQINICGMASTLTDVFRLIEENQIQLIFINKGNCNITCLNVLQKLSNLSLEIILISDERNFAYDVINFQILGYLLKPLEPAALSKVLEKAYRKIHLKQKNLQQQKLIKRMLHQLPTSELVGVPTIEGFEFLVVGDIIRCEGLQKCTRVITKNRTDIISSYNIGEFRKKLEPYGFFATHKSHLINLGKVKKYHKEGTITLTNGSSVPVARRKKTEFLGQLHHL